MTNSEYLKNLEASQIKEEKFSFAVGDTVRVESKVKEGNRERLQAFEGFLNQETDRIIETAKDCRLLRVL